MLRDMSAVSAPLGDDERRFPVPAGSKVREDQMKITRRGFYKKISHRCTVVLRLAISEMQENRSISMAYNTITLLSNIEFSNILQTCENQSI